MATGLSNKHTLMGAVDDVARLGVATQSGTAAQNAAYTGAKGEITYDTDDNRLVAHDGSTAGGHPVATEAEGSAATTAIADRLPVGGEATYAAGLGTVAGAGTAVKLVAVTTAKGDSNGLTVGADNTFTATFTTTRLLRVRGRFDLDVASGADNLTMHVFVGGASVFETAAQAVTALTLVQFEFDVLLSVDNGEAIEIYVENEDTTENITSAAASDRLDGVAAHGFVQITG